MKQINWLEPYLKEGEIILECETKRQAKNKLKNATNKRKLHNK